MQESDKNNSLSQIPALPNSQALPIEEQPSQLASTCRMKDHVDWVIEGWEKELPTLDVTPIAIISRLERLQTYLRSEISTVFERFGLSSPSFAVIATLRRAGQPYQLSQRALMDALQLTGGTVSVRVDRLEHDGIVERLADPSDQRGVLVRLTEKGVQLIEQIAPIHLANEDRLLSALNAQQRTELANLLRILLLSFDAISPEDPYHPSHLLGASLAPAHIARKIRRSSGLPEIPGLLVQSVTIPGLAREAGLQEGDLIISANDQEIRSIEMLSEQLQTTHNHPFTLEILRGQEHRTVILHPSLK